jgi:hypothetical protein
VTAERARAPVERFTVHPSLVNAARFLSRNPARLALTAAASAATAAAVVGVAAGPSPATTTAGSLHAASYSSPVISAHDDDIWSPLHAAAPAAARDHGGQVTVGQAAAAQSSESTEQAGGSPHAVSSEAPAAVQSPAAQPAAPASPPAPPPPPPQPYTIYDSVTPSALPSSSQAVAVYANGSYAASPSQVGNRGLVLWIDTNASDTHASVLDVEPGDATPSQAATWVQQKLNAAPNSTAIVYTMRSDWGAVQQAVAQLPWWMPSHTKYWIADPTGVPHIVPGSQATQWYWGQNYDMSMAAPNF